MLKYWKEESTKLNVTSPIITLRGALAKQKLHKENCVTFIRSFVSRKGLPYLGEPSNTGRRRRRSEKPEEREKKTA